MPAPTPPAGYGNTTCTSLSPPVGGYSMQEGSSPAVALNDVFVVQLLSVPDSFNVLVNGDGTIEVECGDNTARQSIGYSIWRTATDTTDPFNTIWTDETAVQPVWGGPINVGSQLVGASFSLNMATSALATSPAGDPLTFSLASGSLPPGIEIVGNLLAGVFSAASSPTFTIGAADTTGRTIASPLSQIMVSAAPAPPLTPPQGCFNAWTADGALGWTADGFPGWSADGYEPTNLQCAVEEFSAVGVNVGALSYAYSANGTPLGYVITGYPWLAEVTPPGDYVPLVISNGPAPPGSTVAPPIVTGKYYYDAQLAILQASLLIAPPNFVLAPGVTPGIVTGQSLPSSPAVAVGTQMTITVSGFPVIMQPDTVQPVP